jgi:orotidine-5'-phosphate decarboxylase
VVSPILVALDVPDASRARRLAEDLAGYVGGFKVGLELMMAEGPGMIEEIAGLGLPVFADAKLHDIPNTVSGAARQLGRHGARWLTVHGSGGAEMIEAAVAGLGEGSGVAGGVLAVTVLTSLDKEALSAIGVDGGVGDQVARLSVLAAGAGAEGVVCAVGEISRVREVSGALTVVTPGIRPEGSEGDDQRRPATLSSALSAGADYVVVGRAITAAPDPVEAARSMSAEVAAHSAN